MGRIVANVRITNALDTKKVVECSALVDTDAAHLVLPKAWQKQLGELRKTREVNCEIATQDLAKAAVCGPVEIQVEEFPPVHGEVLFLEMEPKNGTYEPLLGHIVLEKSEAAVDMPGLRLLHIKKTDLKTPQLSERNGLSRP